MVENTQTSAAVVDDGEQRKQEQQRAAQELFERESATGKFVGTSPRRAYGGGHPDT